MPHLQISAGSPASAADASLTLANPAHQAGDTLLAVVLLRTQAVTLSCSTPGWTAADGITNPVAVHTGNTDPGHLYFFQNECDSAAESAPQFDLSGVTSGKVIMGVVLRIQNRNFNENFTLGSVHTTGSSTSIAFGTDSPSINDGNAILALAFIADDWVTAPGALTGQTAGLTWSSLVEFETVDGNDGGFEIDVAVNETGSAYTAGTAATKSLVLSISRPGNISALYLEVPSGPISGTVTYTFEPLTASITANPIIAGTVSRTLAPLTASAAGEVTAITATVGATLAPLTVEAEATLMLHTPPERRVDANGGLLEDRTKEVVAASRVAPAGDITALPPWYDPYALYADFTSEDYARNSTLLANLQAFAGYIFTRTGEQGAIDADGAVQWFPANVPAINSAGYHVYGAATSVLLQSQFATNWNTLNDGVLTPNVAVAPDGTMTMARLADGNAGAGGNKWATNAGTVTVTAGVNTFSCFVKREAGNDWCYLRVNGFDTLSTAWFDLVNGVVGTVSGATAAYMVNLGNGLYRCILVWTTTTDLVGSFYIGSTATNGATTYAGNGSSILIWQAQNIESEYQDGGPLIRTAGVPITLGVSALDLDATLSGEFFTWAVINGPVTGRTRTAFEFSTAGVGSITEALYLRLGSTGLVTVNGQAGSVAHVVPTGIGLAESQMVTGRNVIGVGWRNGKYIIATKAANGTIVIHDDAANNSPLPTGIAEIDIGTRRNDLERAALAIEGVFQRNGTFSDAAITAILEDA